MTRSGIRTITVLAVLGAAWCAVLAWQIVGHHRMKQLARTALMNRARDISTSVGVVIKSQRTFIPHFRLEAALEELAGMSELRSVALFNAVGEVVASGGEPVEFELADLPERGVRWGAETATFVNLVDLGSAADIDDGTPQPRIVLPDLGPRGPSDNVRETTAEADLPPLFTGRRRPPDRGRGVPPATRESGGPDSAVAGERERSATESRRPSGRPPWGWHGFRRPPWMTQEDFDGMLQERGLHGFVLVMSTREFHAAIVRDLWLRLTFVSLALAAAAGLGVGWRNIERSTALQIRLVRASEMNAQLKEMNVAAAGLAHETRNPLNVVRGLAQMIDKQADAHRETRRRAQEIVEEVDRVTARVNEFLDYSRPRDPKPAPTPLGSVVADVARTLEGDIRDKRIDFSCRGDDVWVFADEPLLRQVLFNLALNAIQAVNGGGTVRIVVDRRGSDEVGLEVRDNGPGVPEQYREEIFKPYFTTHKSGIGLGLAVVRQIVLAHGWDIDYTPAPGGGSIFRITGMRATSETP